MAYATKYKKQRKQQRAAKDRKKARNWAKSRRGKK
jgi:hypothetical protein